ncbi:hypothetical protein [Acidianus ambivalens]|uniref:Uncharacterized protein n=1 Tax=Acidianus ambivalens TaxID=2283 RepID=A0A650CTD9_ACIAM|nr:hypothetical protein [Acidianus ambivalens]MQL56454.1 hypothetical protein [Acidianus ambivalens]QGR21089.1 hypothetical protein D1866_02925 [Acidianus ambivalens]
MCNGKIILSLLLNNTTPYPITINGGKISIVQTNQTILVRPSTLAKEEEINVSAPLLPSYAYYSTIGIKV